MAEQDRPPRRVMVINMRAKRRDIDLVDRAAEMRGMTRTAFIMEHAVADARDVIREASVLGKPAAPATEPSASDLARMPSPAALLEAQRVLLREVIRLGTGENPQRQAGKMKRLDQIAFWLGQQATKAAPPG